MLPFYLFPASDKWPAALGWLRWLCWSNCRPAKVSELASCIGWHGRFRHASTFDRRRLRSLVSRLFLFLHMAHRLASRLGAPGHSRARRADA